jgi:hypothetical protein
VLLECVPPAASDDDQLGYIVEQLERRYTVAWGLYDAEAVGGVILRRRLFVYLARKDRTLPALPPHCLNDLLRRVGPEPARCVNRQVRCSNGLSGYLLGLSLVRSCAMRRQRCPSLGIACTWAPC